MGVRQSLKERQVFRARPDAAKEYFSAVGLDGTDQALEYRYSCFHHNKGLRVIRRASVWALRRR